MSDELFRERAGILALLATHYPSHLQHNEDEPGYESLFIGLPTGQTAWYIAEDDLDLFDHVRTDITEAWDGHDTEERAQRVADTVYLKLPRNSWSKGLR